MRESNEAATPQSSFFASAAMGTRDLLLTALLLDAPVVLNPHPTMDLVAPIPAAMTLAAGFAHACAPRGSATILIQVARSAA